MLKFPRYKYRKYENFHQPQHRHGQEQNFVAFYSCTILRERNGRTKTFNLEIVAE